MERPYEHPGMKRESSRVCGTRTTEAPDLRHGRPPHFGAGTPFYRCASEHFRPPAYGFLP